MKAISLKEHIKYEDVSEPILASAHDVKILVASVGLCGSDIYKILHGGTPNGYLKTNILGHEVSGTVVEIGSDVTSLAIGDRVVVEPIFPPSYKENYQFDIETKFLGRDIQGAFSEYIVVPEGSVFKIASSLDFNTASLTDVVAVALHGIHRCVHKKSKIAIIGDGAIALSTIALFHILGLSSDLICIGCSKKKLELAQELGATKTFLSTEVPSSEHGIYDVVFEAVGGAQPKTLEQAIELSSPTGVIGIFGVFQAGFQHNIQLRPAFYKELSIVGLNSYSIYKRQREFKMALDILEKHSSVFSKIITHNEPLHKFNEIMELIRIKDENFPVKAVFNP